MGIYIYLFLKQLCLSLPVFGYGLDDYTLKKFKKEVGKEYPLSLYMINIPLIIELVIMFFGLIFLGIELFGLFEKEKSLIISSVVFRGIKILVIDVGLIM